MAAATDTKHVSLEAQLNIRRARCPAACRTPPVSPTWSYSICLAPDFLQFSSAMRPSSPMNSSCTPCTAQARLSSADVQPPHGQCARCFKTPTACMPPTHRGFRERCAGVFVERLQLRLSLGNLQHTPNLKDLLCHARMVAVFRRLCTTVQPPRAQSPRAPTRPAAASSSSFCMSAALKGGSASFQLFARPLTGELGKLQGNVARGDVGVCTARGSLHLHNLAWLFECGFAKNLQL